LRGGNRKWLRGGQDVVERRGQEVEVEEGQDVVDDIIHVGPEVTGSGGTCVEAAAQRGPGLVVLPQVPQVPVALVLHQADHLFICQQQQRASY